MKDTIVLLIVGLTKWHKHSVKVELNLSNYTTKADFKKAAGVDTSNFAKKVYLANLNSEIDKLDICKPGTTPVDFSKLSNVVKNNVVK